MRKRRALAVLVGALALAACAHPVPAAQQDGAEPVSACGPVDGFDDSLRARYAERPVWRGMTAQGAGLVIYQAPAGNWTALLVAAGGMACISAHGGSGAVIRPAAWPAGGGR